jgi:hypothetical protein
MAAAVVCVVSNDAERLRLRLDGPRQGYDTLEYGSKRVKEYFKRPQDVLDAIRSLGRLGLSVSLPDLGSDGQMFFRIQGRTLSVVQILELVDGNNLDSRAIREYGIKERGKAVGRGA